MLFVYELCDDVNLIKFANFLLAGNNLCDLLHCGWIFYPNDKNPKIGSFSCR